MKERIHVCIPTGLRKEIDAVCGGSLPPKDLPHCRACTFGVAYIPERFKEMRHETKTEEHPFSRVPVKQLIVSPIQKKDL